MEAEIEHPGIEVDPFTAEPPLAWSVLFGNPHPTELEIGCGKGLFLRESARLHPERNYLGVERAGKYYHRALERLARSEVRNVRLLRADGLDVLDRWVAPGSLAALHILFPDPWPKKRHHKRRIFRPALMLLAHRALATGGEIQVATDHVEYREEIEGLLADHAGLFTSIPGPGDPLPTNYALKWTRLGRPLWWARYRARAGD